MPIDYRKFPPFWLYLTKLKTFFKKSISYWISNLETDWRIRGLNLKLRFCRNWSVSSLRFDLVSSTLKFFLEILFWAGVKIENTFSRFRQGGKVIYIKYSKHWPYYCGTHNWLCVQKMLNHGINHGFFLSLFELISCPIHWIVCVLACLNFIFEF